MNGEDTQTTAYETRFVRFDGRRHILGASMLFTADADLRKTFVDHAGEPFAVKRAKFSHRTGCDGMIYVSRSGDAKDLPQGAACTVFGSLGAQPVAACFVPDPEKEVKTSLNTNHRITDIDASAPYSGRCRVVADRLDEFLLLVVDANKHVQLNSPSLRGRKWVTDLVYIVDMIVEDALVPLESDLVVENIAHREAGDRIFTLNRLAFTDGRRVERKLRMAFSFFPV